MKRLFVPVVVLTLGLAGCGGGDEPKTARGVTAIKVGDVDGAPASFLKFGVQKGLFAKYNLNLTVIPQQGGAAIIPGLVSGDLQFGGSNVVSMLLARDRGLKVQIVAPGTAVGTRPEEDFSAVVVPGDSPITKAADLSGQSVAVNTLKNVNEVVLKSYLESQGVDPTTLKFTELGFADMLPALAQHRVAAALVIEPFATLAQSQGDRVLVHPYVAAKPNLAVGTYSATESYVDKHKPIVESFREGCADTAAYITAHPDEYRAALPQIAGVKAELAPKVAIPVWRPTVDAESLDFFAGQMVRYGLVKTKPDVKAALAPQ
jgi:NitT/TauT family transport system substrate-binding protein